MKRLINSLTPILVKIRQKKRTFCLCCLSKFRVEPLSDISIRYAVGLYWVPGHAGVRGNEIADELARGSSILGFLKPEAALGV
jgi:ribonuclease HI